MTVGGILPSRSTAHRPRSCPCLGEIIGAVGHYRFTPGTICRLMWEDYDRTVGKQVAATAA